VQRRPHAQRMLRRITSKSRPRLHDAGCGARRSLTAGAIIPPYGADHRKKHAAKYRLWTTPGPKTALITTGFSNITGSWRRTQPTGGNVTPNLRGGGVIVTGSSLPGMQPRHAGPTCRVSYGYPCADGFFWTQDVTAQAGTRMHDSSFIRKRYAVWLPHAGSDESSSDLTAEVPAARAGRQDAVPSAGGCGT